MRTFGVGCWSFEPAETNTDANLESDPKAFTDAVTGALKSIPTVKNVVSKPLAFAMIVGEANEAFRPDPKDGPAKVLRRPRFRPHPFLGGFEFDIEVPASFYESSPLLKRRGVPNEAQAFHVDLRYTSEFPVVFITSTSPSVDRGSAGLVVVREFLRTEMALRKTKVDLVVLGPSPFWADMTVECVSTDPDRVEGSIESERHGRRVGYDRVDFTCALDVHDEDEALRAVLDQIEPELGLYYQYKSWENQDYAEWHRMNQDLMALVALYEDKGLKTMTKRWFFAGRMSRRLSLGLVKAEARGATQARRGLSLRERTYASTSSRVFEQDLDKRRNFAETEIPGARNMVALLDSRRRYEVNLAAVLLSSTLGGVAGAGLTALVGGGG